MTVRVVFACDICGSLDCRFLEGAVALCPPCALESRVRLRRRERKGWDALLEHDGFTILLESFHGEWRPDELRGIVDGMEARRRHLAE